MQNDFKLNNRDKVLQFENYLEKYYQSKSHFKYSSYLDLVKWYDKYFSQADNGSRIFTAIYDIKINFLFTDFEITKAAQLWQGRADKINSEDLLENFEIFSLSFDILYSLSNYVFKYRALLDKIMGLIILIYSPENYDKYRRGESRKKLFTKIYKEKEIPLNLNPDNIFTYLEQFDNKYRTPEAHATGSMRKWILTITEFNKDDYYNLSLNSWNNLIYIISEIDKLLE